MQIFTNEIERKPTHKNFIFWQQWLFYSSLLFALFGVVIALYGDAPLFMPYNRAIAEIFWNQQDIPANVKAFHAFVLGPLGGAIACAYILLAFIAKYPFKRKEGWARQALLYAFACWFILDSAICIWYGAYFQVYLINSLSVLQKVLPLIFTWKHFR